MPSNQLFHGDCLDVLKTLADNAIDSIVTDPPYGLNFMGKKWDYDVPSEAIWQECLRVLKPGGHLVSFAGSRTYHRMAVRVEDAGFEIRDQLMWIYGSGFPKSHNLSGEHAGWGTALKPAHEPIVLARKPFPSTVANNVQQHGTGALNIDGCRIETGDVLAFDRKPQGETASGWKDVNRQPYEQNTAGRWPANLLHDGSPEVLAGFPTGAAISGGKHSGEKETHNNVGGFGLNRTAINRPADFGGSAARFFYCAKASKKDRDEGLEGFAVKPCGLMEDDNYAIKNGSGNLRDTKRANVHPTVKPTDVMRWLCRLITPPGGTVLDPFTGSGSTGKAALLEGFNFVGIEREAEYVAIAQARIAAVQPAQPLA